MLSINNYQSTLDYKSQKIHLSSKTDIIYQFEKPIYIIFEKRSFIQVVFIQNKLLYKNLEDNKTIKIEPQTKFTLLSLYPSEAILYYADQHYCYQKHPNMIRFKYSTALFTLNKIIFYRKQSFQKHESIELCRKYHEVILLLNGKFKFISDGIIVENHNLVFCKKNTTIQFHEDTTILRMVVSCECNANDEIKVMRITKPEETTLLKIMGNRSTEQVHHLYKFLYTVMTRTTTHIHYYNTNYELWLKIDQFIDRCIKDSQKVYLLNVQYLVSVFNISRSSLQHLFKFYKNTTPCRDIQERIFNQSKYLLCHSCSIKEVAEMSGYYNPQSFSRAFKSKFQMTPRSFIKISRLEKEDSFSKID